MRMSLTLHRGTPTGEVLAQLGPFATSARWQRNAHGARDLSVTVPRTLAEAFRLYAATGLLWLVASDGGAPAWVGLVEEPGLWSDGDGSGATLRALGRWAALDDVRYTAHWSDTRTDAWEPMAVSQMAANTPDRYEFDTNNRLLIAPKRDELFATGAAIGRLGYAIPHQSIRTITRVSFDYEYSLAASWDIRLQTWDAAYPTGGTWTGIATPWSVAVAGTGVNTGSQSLTLTGTVTGLSLTLFYNAAAARYAGETGAYYVRLTNIRVSTEATVTADLIAANIAARVISINPGVLAGTDLASPGLDLRDVIYEDASPTDILNELALWGDGAGAVYVAGVDDAGYLTLDEAGAGGRTWYVDVDDLELSPNRDRLANSVYAVYEEPGGRALRTAAQTDAASITRYGRTRQLAVEARTTSATTAAGIRDTALADRATPYGAAAITIRRAQPDNGGPADPRHIRPGDTLAIRNVPLLGGAELDRVRAFRVGETSYDPIRRRVDVTPEEPLPRLEVLLAQREAGRR